jgi:hypothetical protein
MTMKESVFHKIAAMDHVGDANSLAGTVSRPTN